MSSVLTTDGVRLEVHRFLVAEPKITVGLVHGYAEHCQRYAHVAARFAERGIAMIGVDLRGHGRSGGPRGAIERFEEYHADLEALMIELREAASGGPRALLGHSNGALVIGHWLLGGRGGDLAGVVLTSPFLATADKVPPLKLAAGRLLSRVLPRASIPSGLSGKDVCRDPDMARAYDADPLVFKKANARWFTECARAAAELERRAPEIDLPILLLYAGSDRVVSSAANDRLAAKLRGKNRVAERLEGLCHEVLNEPPDVRGPLIDRVADWLLAQGTPRSSP